MPCDTIETSKVEFLEESTDMELLAKALEALGFTVYKSENSLQFYKGGQAGTYFKHNAQLNLARNWDVNQIKRAYSEQVVNTTAERFGWQISWTTNEDGQKEAEVMKR